MRGGAAALALLIATPAAAVAQDRGERGATSSTPENQWLFSEPRFIALGLDAAKQIFGDEHGPPNNGFYPEFSNMIVGSGFVSIGPGYRYNFANGKSAVRRVGRSVVASVQDGAGAPRVRTRPPPDHDRRAGDVAGRYRR
jgi:hypothetical protein